jgi:hypothetical protein
MPPERGNTVATIVITLDGAFGDSDLSTICQGEITNGNTIAHFAYNSWEIWPAGTAFDTVVSDLNGFILGTAAANPTAQIVVCGFSLGSVVASQWLVTYGPTSTVSPSKLSFKLFGNSARRYGGVLVSNGINPPPTGTPYTVLDVAIQYEGWCDWPTLLTVPSLTSLTPNEIITAIAEVGTLAGQNALLGANSLHNNLTQPWLGATTYAGLNLTADEHYTYTEGNIEYRLYTTYPAPLVQERDPFGLFGAQSLLDSQLRPLIEDKYERPMTVPNITPLGGITSEADSEKFWQNELAKRATKEAARLAPPKILLWDGDMNLRGEVAGWRDVDYEFIENDSGTCALQLSLSHYLAQWVMNFKGRDKRNVIITIDKQGTRWSGFMKSYKVVNTPGNDTYIEITFIHDYEQAKHIYVWCNPFLIGEVQFPKLWIIFGPAKWCLLMTLFVNILRLETSLWTLPDNPLDITQWFPFSLLNTGFWRNIVKPFPFLLDNSNLSIVFSRFQSWHDVAKPVLEDAQLTVVCRRYLPSQGDVHPFSDLAGELNISFIEELAELIPLREGCLVWDIVDNSGWGTQTAFGGSLLTGLIRAAVVIGDDGITEGVDVFTGAPTYPNEYYTPNFLGTSPESPWVIFDAASPYTGVSSSEFTYNEATDTSFLTGGHSMPGVNEAFSAGINAAGDFLTSIINVEINNVLEAPGNPFNGGFVQIPPLGGVMDAIAKIFYEDVFLAFEQTPTNRAAGSTIPLAGLEDTLSGLGDFHFFEGWGDGADRAFTLAAIMATRAKIWETRVYTTHTIKIADAAPYYAGDNGQGDYWIGSRVGTTVPEFPIPYTVFVDRVKKMRYGWGKDGSRGWLATIGSPQQLDPALKALNEIKMINQAAGLAGIL